MTRGVVAALLGLMLAGSAGAAEWTYNMAFTQWAGSNDADRYYTSTPEYCDAKAAQIAAAGYTAVMLSGYHFRLNFLERDDDVRRIARTIVEACHRHGLRVIEHMDLTIGYYDAYPLIWEHPDWLQVHAADMLTVHRIFCFNNEQFRAFYLDYARRFQRETGIDAWQMDEIQWLGRGYCGCAACREKWQRGKGRPYPAVEGPGFFERALADPEYREWMYWRGECLNEFRALVRDEMRAINPDVQMFTYTTALQSSPYIWTRNSDYQSRTRDCDTIGTELNATPFPSYPYIAGLLAQRRALSEVQGQPAWAKFDITGPSAYFCWAFGRACGHSIWWSLSPDNEDPRPQDLLRWPWQMDDAAAVVDADIGVLLSSSTRDLRYDFDYFQEEFDGWVQALLLEPFATRVLLESELTEPGALDRYRLIVLPNCTAISPAQKAALMAWVRAGGRLLLTADAGTLEIGGAPSAAPLLAEAGVTIEGEVAVGFTIEGGPPEPFAAPARAVSADDTEVLATMAAEGRTLPLLTRRPVGAGAVCYLAAKLGPVAWEDAQLSTHYRQGGFIPADDPRAAEQIRTLAGRLLADTPHLRIDGAPPGLLAWSYRAERDGRPARAIHLLNCTGRALQPGDPVEFDGDNPPPMPALPELTLRLPGGASEALLASPELAEPVALRAAPGASLTTITIPAASFATYGVIWAYD